jgi:tetratricopeptide (TPR) repeat protein
LVCRSEVLVATVRDILERAHAAGETIPQAEAAALFSAAMRLSVEQGMVPRPHQLRLDDHGGLTFARDDSGPLAPEYLAPELSSDDPPRRTEPRVLVYAAGALGYELLSGQTPKVPPEAPAAELAGPLADLVRLALSPDRRERFGDLQQLLDAVEVVQPRRPPDVERQLFAALLKRSRGWGGPRTAVPKADQVRLLSVRIDALEAALLQLRAQHEIMAKKLAAAQQAGAPLERELGHDEGPQALGQPARLGTAEGREEEDARGAPALGRIFAAAAFASLLVLGAAASVGYAFRDSILAAATSGTASIAPPQSPVSVAAPPQSNAASAAGAGPVSVPDAGPTTQDALSLAVARSQVARGRQALEQGKPSEAIASFRAALVNQPDLPEALRGLGMAHALQGKEAEAHAEYERYLQLAPEGPEAAEVRRALSELKAGRARR